jgi:hypothetical protein
VTQTLALDGEDRLILDLEGDSEPVNLFGQAGIEIALAIPLVAQFTHRRRLRPFQQA